MTDEQKLDRKIRRRIKKFIKTGIPICRVRTGDGETYVYHVRHGVEERRYKKMRDGRLRRQTDTETN